MSASLRRAAIITSLRSLSIRSWPSLLRKQSRAVHWSVKCIFPDLMCARQLLFPTGFSEQTVDISQRLLRSLSRRGGTQCNRQIRNRNSIGRDTGREEGKEGELENERESPCPLSNSHIYVDDTECPKSSKSHVFFLCGFYFVSLEWLKLYGVQIL